MKYTDLDLEQDHITLLLVMKKMLTDPRCLYFYELVCKWKAEESIALLEAIFQEWLEIKIQNRFLSQHLLLVPIVHYGITALIMITGFFIMWIGKKKDKKIENRKAENQNKSDITKN